MITLTNPLLLPASLGGTATISMDKMVITRLVFDVKTRRIHCDVELSSTANPAQGTLPGNLDIAASDLFATLFIEALDFVRRIALTAGQRTAVNAFIDDAQNDVEGGSITLALVDGIQSPGV